MGTTHIEAERPADRKSLGASLIGQLLEWFEWSSYAVFAPFIAAAFFDKSDPTSALLATFGVFAVGFLVRPLAAPSPTTTSRPPARRPRSAPIG